MDGNPHGNRHRTRHLLNQEFMQALLLHFRQHGKKAIEKVARNQPAAYLKILALLVPRADRQTQKSVRRQPRWVNAIKGPICARSEAWPQ